MAEVRRWPSLFEVTVRDLYKNTYKYRVVTWLHANKAIAIAAEQHARKHPEPESRLYDVEVEDMGQPSRDPSGIVHLEENDLVDRMEW